MSILQHLIDMPDDIELYEPTIERAPLDKLIRKPKTVREAIRSKAATVANLVAHGVEIDMTLDDDDTAVREFQKIIADPTTTITSMPKPAVILKLAAMLSEYDHEVVQNAVQMRTYVTNRLLEESSPRQPPAVRMKALDLLGKINGVDLFTERTELTVKTMPMENLEAQLYSRLKVLLPEEYATIISQTPTPQEH